MDKRTLQLLKEGKREAQSKFFEEFYPMVMRICLRYSQDKDQAEDLMQEVFLKLFRIISTFREDGSLEGWIARITKNQALDLCRKNKANKEISFSRLNSNSYGEEVNYVDDVLLKVEIEVEEEIEPLYSPEAVMKAIQNLSPKYRAVFNLYLMDGYSHQEIADKLDIAVGTSKSNYHGARKSVARYLGVEN